MARLKMSLIWSHMARLKMMPSWTWFVCVGAGFSSLLVDLLIGSEPLEGRACDVKVSAALTIFVCVYLLSVDTPQ